MTIYLIYDADTIHVRTTKLTKASDIQQLPEARGKEIRIVEETSPKGAASRVASWERKVNVKIVSSTGYSYDSLEDLAVTLGKSVDYVKHLISTGKKYNKQTFTYERLR